MHPVLIFGLTMTVLGLGTEAGRFLGSEESLRNPLARTYRLVARFFLLLGGLATAVGLVLQLA